jgi:hypothetical protein
VSYISEKSETHKNLWSGKSKGKTSLWRANIKIGFTEIESEGVGWIQLVKDRVQKRDLTTMVMNVRIP